VSHGPSTLLRRVQANALNPMYKTNSVPTSIVRRMLLLELQSVVTGVCAVRNQLLGLQPDLEFLTDSHVTPHTRMVHER